MSDAELIELVSKMRRMQEAAYRRRGHYEQRCARDYERRVDAELNRRAEEKRAAQEQLL